LNKYEALVASHTCTFRICCITGHSSYTSL